ncbi:hypothetical protein FKP32DRAFT_1029170 [Trametes sanguinea]|nr:hypothetical protein FKP32DRAFT_1029170 [Trametes sanguinea]
MQLQRGRRKAAGLRPARTGGALFLVTHSYIPATYWLLGRSMSHAANGRLLGYGHGFAPMAKSEEKRAILWQNLSILMAG